MPKIDHVRLSFHTRWFPRSITSRPWTIHLLRSRGGFIVVHRIVFVCNFTLGISVGNSRFVSPCKHFLKYRENLNPTIQVHVKKIQNSIKVYPFLRKLGPNFSSILFMVYSALSAKKIYISDRSKSYSLSLFTTFSKPLL